MIEPPPSDPAGHARWLAHELRSPLTVLAGYLELLLEGHPADVELALARISRAVERLVGLADALAASQDGNPTV